MGEIKFRGKRIPNGKWMYGFLLEDENGHVFITNNRGDSCIWEQVDPDTVGQFTGFKCNQAKEIYDGDIIRIDRGEHPLSHQKDHNEIHLVHYWMGCPVYYTRIATGECDVIYLHQLWQGHNRGIACEVIGNIHDNPELLKQKK